MLTPAARARTSSSWASSRGLPVAGGWAAAMGIPAASRLVREDWKTWSTEPKYSARWRARVGPSPGVRARAVQYRARVSSVRAGEGLVLIIHETCRQRLNRDGIFRTTYRLYCD